jgi:hypothetical protein
MQNDEPAAHIRGVIPFNMIEVVKEKWLKDQYKAVLM